MFVILCRQKDMDKIKYKFQREIAEINKSRLRLCKIYNLGPGHSLYEFYKWYIFHCKSTHVNIINCISLCNDGVYIFCNLVSKMSQRSKVLIGFFCLDTDCQNNGGWLSTNVAYVRVFTVSTDEINNNKKKNRSKIKKRNYLNYYQCMTEFLLMASSPSVP